MGACALLPHGRCLTTVAVVLTAEMKVLLVVLLAAGVTWRCEDPELLQGLQVLPHAYVSAPHSDRVVFA
jgi:hypothetical protein